MFFLFEVNNKINFIIVYFQYDLLPQKPSEIALGNGISRHLGGVLGIVFN